MKVPEGHPRYHSLKVREWLVTCAREGIVTLEGLTAHGRGEAFDYMLGERSTESALQAEKTAAALLIRAKHPVLSVNGNTAALARDEIKKLQEVSGIPVEVNLFHRTDERVNKVTQFLEAGGIRVLKGNVERLLPLQHDRALCLKHGIYAADVVLVPLEDGDRCAALVSLGKCVIAIDLNPLSRTARTASLTIVDEVRRALPRITEGVVTLTEIECDKLIHTFDNRFFLQKAREEMTRGLSHGVD